MKHTATGPYWAHSDPHAPTLCELDCGRHAHHGSRVCGGCYAQLRRHLRELWAIHVWFGHEMIRTGHPTASTHDDTGLTAERRGTSADAPTPIILDLHDMRVTIREWLLGRIATDHRPAVQGWIPFVAYEHTPALAGPRDREIDTSMTWLEARLPWICEQYWATMFVWQVRILRSVCHRIRPWRAQRIDLHAPCPKCDVCLLSLYGGDDHVTCRNPACGYELPKDLYQHYVRVLADEQRLLNGAVA